MNELTVIENQPLTAAQVRTQVNTIQEIMKAVMKPGTHYGTVPGCGDKPTLLKPGAEKLLATFRIAVDPSVEDMSTHDCFRYRVICRGVLPSGEIVGAGVGECSTDEEKYKWRSAVCDEEFNATQEDRRRNQWKKGGYGKPAYQVKQVRTNPADLANTVLKMAKKRAQVDLTLTATGASDIFTQDIEELPPEFLDQKANGNGNSHSNGGKPPVSSPQSKPPTDNGDMATQGQVKILYVKMKQAGVTEADFLAHFQVDSVADLPRNRVNEAIKALADGEVKPPAADEPPVTAQDEPEKIKCKNCGEMIDPLNNTGHLLDCSYATT